MAQLPMARGESDGFRFLGAFTHGVIAETHKRSLPYAGRPIMPRARNYARRGPQAVLVVFFFPVVLAPLAFRLAQRSVQPTRGKVMPATKSQVVR